MQVRVPLERAALLQLAPLLQQQQQLLLPLLRRVRVLRRRPRGVHVLVLVPQEVPGEVGGGARADEERGAVDDEAEGLRHRAHDGM